MSNAKGALSLLLVLAAGLLLAPSARADSQVRIVRLSLVSGPVQIDRGDGYEKAIMNMPIAQGMKLWTQADSRAEVEFEDGGSMRLTPGAKVDFEQLMLLSSGAKASTVKVNAGKVYFDVPHKGNNDFRVAFGDQQLSLTRSVHFRLDLTSDHAEIAVLNGELALQGPKEEKIKKNQTATLDLGENAPYQLAKGITPSPFDEWDNYRLQFENNYASAGSKNVPYQYGRTDLNYYGSWGYVAGYGNLWRPFGYGYGWDPFFDGAWAWYPGAGYTWVSSYPWGWMPYRYGNWVWAPNFGWCWRPGGFNAWTGLPTVLNPPPGYKPPQPPPINNLAGTAATGAPRPPTVVVGRGITDSHDPRPRFGKDSNLVLSDGERVRPGVRTSAAPAPGAAASASQPTRPVRTFVPRSGPGMGQRPMPMDDTGVVSIHSAGGHMRDEGARPMPTRQGIGAPPAPRTGGSPPPAPRLGVPPSPQRQSAPSARPSAPSHSGGNAPSRSTSSHSAPSSPRPK
jgi:FecR protein